MEELRWEDTVAWEDASDEACRVEEALMEEAAWEGIGLEREEVL